MVVQAAVPLTVIATQMGMSVPAVIEYFKGQNIDLSGYGANDLVDLETIFPQTESERIKEYKTYGDSFYNAPPVVGDTSLDNIVLQTKKDDDEKITTIDQEGRILPDLPDQMPEPDPEDNDPKKTVVTTSAEAVAEELAKEGTDKIIKDLTNQYKKIDQQRKNFLTDSDPQTEDTSVETINPKDFLAKDKNTKFYIEALVPDKINGEVDLREIDYLNKEAPIIDYKFNVKTLNDVKQNTIKEINKNSNVDVVELANNSGFKLPDLDLINKALEGGADERYWYQKGSQWLDNFLSDFTPEEQNDFYDILSVTSGGLTPYQNLNVAIGVFSDHINNRPIRIGFRQGASLNKFLLNPENDINSPKFGNYVDTFKYFNGLSDREPNTVIDLQMSEIFGIDQKMLTSKPELYALVTEALGNLTDEVNKTLPEGEELQPFELQAKIWSAFRESKNLGGATNYAQMGEKLVKDLQDQGFVFKDDKLNREELVDPQFVEKLQATVGPYSESMKATIEVGSYLTPNGKKIEQLINNFPNDTVLMNQINQVHKSNLTKLISKKNKQPSVMENLISAVIGEKAEVSRMITGLGTYDGKANFNVIVPLTVKTKNGVVPLEESQRKQILSLLGLHLDQDAMGASNFNILDEGESINPNATPTIQLYIQSSFTQEDVQQLHKLTGLDFNITPVPGGFVASALSDGMPSEKDMQNSFEKVFGKDKDMMYIPSKWVSDYIESNEYKENINGLQESISERMEGDGATSFNIEYLDSIISTIKAIASSRNEGYGKILDSTKVINLLTKNNIKLKSKGGSIEIPTFHFGGFIDINRL